MHTDSDAPKPACHVIPAGKARAGYPRWWCTVHQASATGRYGAKRVECEAAHTFETYDNTLQIDAEDYRGGIALWGVVDPVYDTTNLPRETGVHLHARKSCDSPQKAYDGSYPAVSLRIRRDLLESKDVLITEKTAISLYISRYLENDIKCLFCDHCGAPHLDLEYFAVKPHRRHLCHACGKYFHDREKAVGNPIVCLPGMDVNQLGSRPLIHSSYQLDVNQRDYPGGIQIWASNPAIFWTADRPEQKGLHVHLYDGKSDTPVRDETFGAVRLDGILLDESMTRQLMAQQSLPYLANKVTSLRCPQCQELHFDTGRTGFFPHKNHCCEHCGAHFSHPRRKLVVSNPASAVLTRLYTQSPHHRQNSDMHS